MSNSVGLILFFLIAVSAAHKIQFQQSDVTFTVPLIDNNRHVFDKIPLIKLDALDTSSSSSRFAFAMDKSLNYFHLNETTGELWLKAASIVSKRNFSQNLIIKLIKSMGDDVTRITMNINFLFLDNLSDFCEESMCFYDSSNFYAIEDFGDSFKSREVAEIAPRFYRRLCRQYHVDYTLLNATEYFTINKNKKIITAATLDREKLPNIKVNVQCHVKLGSSFWSYKEKVFNLTIVDLNDNAIRVQDNHKATNLTLGQYFVQDDLVDRDAYVVFIDNDTLDANSDIEFHVVNDKLNIFNEACKRHERTTNGIASTVVYCGLKYVRDGHFDISEYCVTLQAKESLKKKIHNEDVSFCFQIELSPVALALKSEKKTRKITENIGSLATTSGGGSGKIQKLINIEYPSEVVVLQNASYLARVVQPKTIVNDANIRFELINDQTNSFDITHNGGIIYVQNFTNLDELLPAKYQIKVSWNYTSLNLTQNATISIKIVEATYECEMDDSVGYYCSHYEFQSDCEAACGVGSKNGRCKWRPHKPDENNANYSLIYSTCVPDIDSCTDNRCDQLEQLGRDMGEYLCSQDCTKKDIFGVLSTTSNGGIGRVKNGDMCACVETKCHCGPAIKVTTTTTTSELPTSEIPYNPQSVIGSDITDIKKSSDCGVLCLLIMVGSPSLLVFMIIILVTMRRRYVKKIKKRMMLSGSTVHYRGSNDTEIININILNEVQKENYLQTYQKFDFDAKWEFDRAKLILDTTLGEGEFGKVLKAYVSDIEGSDAVKTVAVKTVKTSHNSVELLALLSEFQLLQEVSHPNVIKLLGACIKSEPPLIIIEYCCFGSLRSYLRLSRKLEESGDLDIDGVEPVTAKDVLSFSWQICKGMAYLADIKLVHRDLAARNVLLAEGKVCKISDFGLTRDVYEDDAYLKKSKDRVPVKWMSPESLADHVYTIKTDIWSFGVVGWEIITLGATPYPGIPPQNLYHLLRSGYRMQRPENCSPEIYMLLEACWADDPTHRPSFKSLATKFENLLGKCAKYLDVDIRSDGAISNPLYLSNIDEDIQSNKTEETDLDYKRIDTLWSAPKFKSDINKVDNQKYLLKYDDQLQLLLARYDKPKPLNEGKFANNQKLRYQNDFQTFLKPNRYVNTSQPELLSLADGERLASETRYDAPSLRRMKSYIEMRNIARARKSSNSTTNDSFDDNNNEMPCASKRTTINENLNFNDLDKLLNADKEISFKFSSLNNLNQRLTETKC